MHQSKKAQRKNLALYTKSTHILKGHTKGYTPKCVLWLQKVPLLEKNPADAPVYDIFLNGVTI